MKYKIRFCTPDSLEASSNYLNILLTTYGYTVPLVFDSTEVEEKCKIVNCIYALLQDRKVCLFLVDTQKKLLLINI